MPLERDLDRSGANKKLVLRVLGADQQEEDQVCSQPGDQLARRLSPVSGPLRYDFCPDAATWVNSRDGHALFPLLAADFEQLVGAPLDFGEVEADVRDAAEGL